MYIETDQQTLDIDWFFTDGKHIGFVASGAGKLSETVAGSAEDNKQLVSYVRSLPKTSDIIVNPFLDDLLTEISRSGANDRYLKDFIYFTQKGLFSFDKTNLNNFTDHHYHLVTTPVNPLEISNLPQDILDILIKTKYSGDMGIVKDLDVSKIT
jgi:hypothetical protein